MDAEAAFNNYIGTLGKYQFLLCVLLVVGNIIVSQQLLLMVIVGATPNISIEDEKNLSTIVTEFNLYNKSWVVDLIQSLLMGGYLLGSMIFGQLSDTKGRHSILVFSSFFGGVASLCSGFATNWKIFAVTRFLTGIFVGGSSVAIFVLLTELIGRKVWASMGMIFQVFFSLGVCTLAGLGLWIKQWHIICFITGGLGVVVSLFYFLLLPESPRWLYSVGKIQKAESIMRTIARRNGKRNLSFDLSLPSENPSTLTLIDLFRHCKLSVWLIVSCFLWFTNGLVYYGLTLSAADLTSNLYLGIALSGAIEIPANILCIFMIDFKWLGRKRSLSILYFLCVVCSIASMFVSGDPNAKLALGLLNKLAIVGCFNICFIYSSEIFPTPLRSAAVGLSLTSARIGSVLAPFVPFLGNTHYFLPFLIFAITAAVSFFLLVLLPSTLGRPIPQTLEEALGERQYKILSEVSDAEHPGFNQ